MAEVQTAPTAGKRPLEDLEFLLNDEEPVAKRACTETPSSSAHLSLLEELCDFEGDETEPPPQQPSTVVLSPQEDLVAEMMKSLEKVIEEGEKRDAEEVSPSGTYSSLPCLKSEHTTVLVSQSRSEACISYHGDLSQEDSGEGDLQISELLQASADELGPPLSSSSSDLEEYSEMDEEWAFLSEQSAASYSWLEDGGLQPFEEAREVYELPLTLF